MKRIALAFAALAAFFAASRPPVAIQAEQTFFRALNHEPQLRKSAIRELTVAYTVAPDDGRAALLLGLAHLWSAAEGDRANAASTDHLVLAEHHLARAQKLLPQDRRIPSWLVPARLSIAGIERDATSRERIRADLEAAYKEDPNFHSFTMALLAFGHPRQSPEFRRGLEVLHAAAGCTDSDPSCANQPRWPHNREGFNLFLADYELKAGNAAAAKQFLERVKAQPDYATFGYPEEVEERLANLDRSVALYANGDPGDDPPPITSGAAMCQVCHRTK